MANDDERVARLQRGWKFAYAAKQVAADRNSSVGPYDEEDRKGSEVVAPLTKDTADRMKAQGERAVQGSFRKGGKVRKTGIYKLHKGERVVRAKSSSKRRK